MRVSHVAAIAELGDVFPSVFGRNVNVSSLHGALKQRPVTFKAVHMMNATHIFFCGVVDRFVGVMTAQILVSTELISADGASRLDVFFNDAFKCVGAYVRDRTSNNFALALKHREYGRLIDQAFGRATFSDAPDESFINFDVTGQWATVTGIGRRRNSLQIRQAHLYVTPVCRSISLAATPCRVLVMRYIAKNQTVSLVRLL